MSHPAAVVVALGLQAGRRHGSYCHHAWHTAQQGSLNHQQAHFTRQAGRAGRMEPLWTSSLTENRFRQTKPQDLERMLKNQQNLNLWWTHVAFIKGLYRFMLVKFSLWTVKFVMLKTEMKHVKCNLYLNAQKSKHLCAFQSRSEWNWLSWLQLNKFKSNISFTEDKKHIFEIKKA